MEIRQQASNQSTEVASCAIGRLLEMDSCEESSNGWMLLQTLNLLAAGPPHLEVSGAQYLFLNTHWEQNYKGWNSSNDIELDILRGWGVRSL